MRYVRDLTGRFRERPHYEPDELDQECERIITAFMVETDGRLVLPLSTDVLTKLIERDAQDLDLYADLSAEGPDVEGVTDFYPGEKPKVRIAAALADQEWREHRLRTTLTHEYGHVKFHAYLWDLEPARQDMFPDLPRRASRQCRRQTVLTAPTSDWMEWQAGYVCGALLMPVTMVRRVAGDFRTEHGLYGACATSSPHGRALIGRVAEAFDVSADAARVRLSRLGYLADLDAGPSLLS